MANQIYLAVYRLFLAHTYINGPFFTPFMNLSYELRIPKERIAVLIGTEGETKKRLEEDLQIKILIDSKEGDVTVIGEDAVQLYTGKEIVRAVARGFNPQIALLLLKQDYAFELIDLADYVKNSNHMQRLKGRVIGTEGKSRRLIEESTESYISVYGKTIGVIAPIDTITITKQAIHALLSGSPHSSVYRWLEKKRREIKRSRVLDDKGF
jgi:ribosomal RNA assembly protein